MTPLTDEELEKIRLRWMGTGTEPHRHIQALLDTIAALKAERDEWKTACGDAEEAISGQILRAEAAEQEIKELKALLDLARAIMQRALAARLAEEEK